MSNQAVHSQAIAAWAENPQNAALVSRGIDESTWNALNSTIYPGAKTSSILMAVDYCKARGLDIMLKPVHLVPMNVKNAQTNQYEWRDVPMPGIGLYRIQAERSGTYAGADAPEFGPDVTKQLGNVSITYPEWCKVTVHKLIGDRLVAYSAIEYWIENYATKGKGSEEPNAMWAKRPRGQLAKCAEAQALRKAWPEVGQEATAEEMEGKEYIKDVTHSAASKTYIEQPAIEQLVSQEQINQLLNAAEAVGKDASYICEKARIDSIEQLEAIRFDMAIKHLESLAVQL